MDSSQAVYWNKFYKSNLILESKCSDFCRFVISFFKNVQIKSVLDCGFGTGRDTFELGKHYKVKGVDNSGYIPDAPPNIPISFETGDFVHFDKSNFDLIYSRFTFHSINDLQQRDFLESVPRHTYIAIETRSNKSKDDKLVHGNDTHYRNLTDLGAFQQLIEEKNFEVLYIKEDANFAIYKGENPICICAFLRRI